GRSSWAAPPIPCPRASVSRLATAIRRCCCKWPTRPVTARRRAAAAGSSYTAERPVELTLRRHHDERVRPSASLVVEHDRHLDAAVGLDDERVADGSPVEQHGARDSA